MNVKNRSDIKCFSPKGVFHRGRIFWWTEGPRGMIYKIKMFSAADFLADRLKTFEPYYKLNSVNLIISITLI